MVLDGQTAGDAIHLVSGLDLSDLYNLRRSRGFGSTFATEQVNPRNVHSEVMCLMPCAFMRLIIESTTSGCMMTALLGTKVPTPIA